MTTKAQATKDNIDKLDFMKISNFCTSSNTIREVKGQSTEQKKCSAKSGKGPILRTYKELKNKKTA
jgi:hypothetical protein